MPNRKNFLSVEVYFPSAAEKKSFQTEARVVSSENKLGKFDILPQHINFATLIFNSLIIETIKRKKIIHQFKKGVLIVKENKVKIFLGL